MEKSEEWDDHVKYLTSMNIAGMLELQAKMRDVPDRELQDIISYVAKIERNRHGVVANVQFERKDSLIALMELGRLLGAEDADIKEMQEDGNRVLYSRNTFSRLSTWRVPSTVLVPLLLQIETEDSEHLGKVIWLFVALLLPPPSNASQRVSAYRLLAETRSCFANMPVLVKLRSILLALLLKRRSQGPLTKHQCNLISGVLELILSLVRLPDLPNGDGTSSMLLDRILARLSETHILDMLRLVPLTQEQDIPEVQEPVEVQAQEIQVSVELPPPQGAVIDTAQPSLLRDGTLGETQLQLEIVADTQDIRHMPVPGDTQFTLMDTQDIPDTQLPNILDSKDEPSHQVVSELPPMQIRPEGIEVESDTEVESSVGGKRKNDESPQHPKKRRTQHEESSRSSDSSDEETNEDEDVKAFETSEHKQFWAERLMHIMNWILQKQDMQGIVTAALEAKDGKKEENKSSALLSDALSKSINNEKRKRAMQEPKLSAPLGKQGFFVRNNQIVRAETLAKGGISEVASKPMKRRVALKQETNMLSTRVQGYIGNFFRVLVDEVATVMIDFLQPGALLTEVEEFSVHTADHDELFLRFMVFAKTSLSFCRLWAGATRQPLDLSQISSLLKEEMLLKAFDLCFKYHQQSSDKTLGPQARYNHHTCLSFLTEAFITIASLLNTYKPSATVVLNPAYTAARGLVVSLLSDESKIHQVKIYLKQYEIYRHTEVYRNELLQLVHVIFQCLDHMSREGKVYLKKKVRRKVKKRDMEASEEAENEELSAASVMSEGSSTIMSEWTTDDNKSYDTAKVERKKKRKAERRTKRTMRHQLTQEDVVLDCIQHDMFGIASLLSCEYEGKSGLQCLFSSLQPNPPESEDSSEVSDAPSSVAVFEDDQASDDSIISVVQDKELTVRTVASDFVQPKIVMSYIDALRDWQTNAPETNVCIVAFLKKVAFELNYAPCVLSIEALQLYEEILATLATIRKQPELRADFNKFQELGSIATLLVRKWFTIHQQNPYWVVLSLGWLTRSEAVEAETGFSLEDIAAIREGAKEEDEATEEQLEHNFDDEDSGDMEVVVTEAMELRSAKRAMQRWGPADDETLKSSWELYSTTYGDGFVGDMKHILFRYKKDNPKTILQRAISMGLAIPANVRALPLPKAQWCKTTESALRDNLEKYATPAEGLAGIARLREDILPAFTEDQILKKAKAMKIERGVELHKEKADAQKAAREEQKRQDKEFQNLIAAHVKATEGDEDGSSSDGSVKREKKRKRKSKEKKERKKRKKEKKSKRVLIVEDDDEDENAELEA